MPLSPLLLRSFSPLGILITNYPPSWQFQPTKLVHDPNPPIVLLDVADPVASPTWAAFGEVTRLIDTARFVPAAVFAVEIIGKTNDVAQPIWARLFNVTTSAPVVGSEISTNSLTPLRIRSAAFALAGANLYRIEFGGLPGALYTCYDAGLWVGVG